MVSYLIQTNYNNLFFICFRTHHQLYCPCPAPSCPSLTCPSLVCPRAICPPTLCPPTTCPSTHRPSTSCPTCPTLSCPTIECPPPQLCLPCPTETKCPTLSCPVLSYSGVFTVYMPSFGLNFSSYWYVNFLNRIVG